MTCAVSMLFSPVLAQVEWGWLIMVLMTALIAIVIAVIVLLVVWLTGGLHDG